MKPHKKLEVSELETKLSMMYSEELFTELALIIEELRNRQAKVQVIYG